MGQAEDYAVYIKQPDSQRGVVYGLSDTICYGGIPVKASFIVSPSGNNISYQWYFRAGISSIPTGEQTDGWTLVSGATSGNYTPPSGLTASRTYACQASVDGDPYQWAAGVHYLIVLAQPGNGDRSGNYTILKNTSPGGIMLSPAPAGDRAFSYQWYSKVGFAAAPTGTSTAGWTLIPGGTTMPFNPGILSQNMTFACFVTPIGNPPCGSAGWANGVRQYTVVNSYFDSGKLVVMDTSLCNGDTPGMLSFERNPGSEGPGGQTGEGKFYYRWCYRYGLHEAPEGPYQAEWIVIPGADSLNYYPGPQTQSVTFACFVSRSSIYIEGGAWAEGCIRFNVLPPFNPGQLNQANESVCVGQEAGLIAMDELPSGAVEYAYQWHYREGTQYDCPSGSNKTGWLPVGEDTQNSFQPGAVAASRTYALLIQPGGTPACGDTVWAEGCRRISLIPAVSYGQLEAGDQYFMNSGDPNPVRFTILPSGADNLFTYQWYSADTLVYSASDLSFERWHLIVGADSSVYDPPLLSESTSFACQVIPADTSCDKAGWAEGAHRIIIETPTGVQANDIPASLTVIPNPFSGSASIRCLVPESVHTSELRLFSIDGRLLRTIPLTTRGKVNQTLNAEELSQSIYLLQLIFDNSYTISQKFVVQN